MNTFHSHLKSGLFPEMPASFSDKVHRALELTGVHPKTRNPFLIVSTVVAAAAVAASMLLVLTSAWRNTRQEIAVPDETAVVSPAVTEEPVWNTEVRAATDPDGRVTREMNARYAQSILSFLRDLGEPEPKELWILNAHAVFVRDDEPDLPVIVLAQSNFEGEAGPELYCLTPSGDLLWGTVGSSQYPNRVTVDIGGQTCCFLYGTNAVLGEPQLSHITRGAITGLHPGQDIEFSVCISSAAKWEAFGGSAHYDSVRDYFLVRCDESNLDQLLRLETEGETYTISIRSGVPEVDVVTAEQASAYRKMRSDLPQPTEAPDDGTVVLNLSAYDDGEASKYVPAIMEAIQRIDVQPRSLWLVGIWPLPYSADDPSDAAYVLAQYQPEGESSPELFFWRDGAVEWMTSGSDSYSINAVTVPDSDSNIAFGYSPAFDNGALAMREGYLLTLDGSRYPLDVQLPLLEVLMRVGAGSPYYSAAREAFLCIYPSEQTETRIDVFADGRSDPFTLFSQGDPGVIRFTSND